MAVSSNLLPILISADQHPAFEGPSDWHSFDTPGGHHLLVTDGTRIYSIDRDTFETLAGSEMSADVLNQLGIPSMNSVTDEPVANLPIRSLSLAVAQKCNLGCTYCYAEGGSFGSTARNMSSEVALKAVGRLFEDVAPGERFNLSFLGGEPLSNREVLFEATEAAARRATELGIHVGFSITTNATMLTEADAKFFERHGFAVTISLDGVSETHDRLRPFKGGRGSYQQVINRVTPLLKHQRRMQVSARVTVTPRNLELRRTLDEFIGLGFHSVGFSPMLSSPTGQDQMGTSELDVMLEQMIDCGSEFARQVEAGNRYPFSNMVNALKELHHGTHRPYPCGAGGGYMGVSADGDLFACHRFVDDPVGAMGSVDAGVDLGSQERWLRERHVHFQSPCSGCWARYLCGGGCHHEVIQRGRPACDYIRGWLHFCLQSYSQLLETVPDWFGRRTVAQPTVPD